MEWLEKKVRKLERELAKAKNMWDERTGAESSIKTARRRRREIKKVRRELDAQPERRELAAQAEQNLLRWKKRQKECDEHNQPIKDEIAAIRKRIEDTKQYRIDRRPENQWIGKQLWMIATGDDERVRSQISEMGDVLKELEDEIKALQSRFKWPGSSGALDEKDEPLTQDKLKELEVELARLLETLPELEAAEDAEKVSLRKANEEIGKAESKKRRREAEKMKRLLQDQFRLLKTCPYCRGPIGDEPNADHIYPVVRGGLSNPVNMVIVCATCNNAKSDLTLREFIKRQDLDRDEIELILDELGKRF